MSYWKVKDVKIEDDGLALTISFKDEHSKSYHCMTLPAETWKDIIIFQAAYNEPERRMWEAQKNLCDYWHHSFKLAAEKNLKET